jgi:Lhr-like helicase
VLLGPNRARDAGSTRTVIVDEITRWSRASAAVHLSLSLERTGSAVRRRLTRVGAVGDAETHR